MQVFVDQCYKALNHVSACPGLDHGRLLQYMMTEGIRGVEVQLAVMSCLSSTKVFDSPVLLKTIEVFLYILRPIEGPGREAALATPLLLQDSEGRVHVLKY